MVDNFQIECILRTLRKQASLLHFTRPVCTGLWKKTLSELLHFCCGLRLAGRTATDGDHFIGTKVNQLLLRLSGLTNMWPIQYLLAGNNFSYCDTSYNDYFYNDTS